MIRGPKPRSRPGRHDEALPVPPAALPRCPGHLTDVARKEWRRLATPLHEMGVLSVTDRAALAAYCQAWARWVGAEQHLQKGPPLIKTPSGRVQQSPWLSIANKQLEIMGRFMTELGLSPSVHARLRVPYQPGSNAPTEIVITFAGADDPEGEDDSRRSDAVRTSGRILRLHAHPARRRREVCRPQHAAGQ